MNVFFGTASTSITRINDVASGRISHEDVLGRAMAALDSRSQFRPSLSAADTSNKQRLGMDVWPQLHKPDTDKTLSNSSDGIQLLDPPG
jgi:hypothetical protein